MKQRLRLARGEGFANEGTEIFIVADGGGEEKLIKLLRGVAVGGRRGHFAAHFRRLHRCLIVGDGEGAAATVTDRGNLGTEDLAWTERRFHFH